MKNDLSHLANLLVRYPQLLPIHSEIAQAYNLCADCYDHFGTLFTCGNGGLC